MNLEAHFVKTNDFKTIQASGVTGGIFKTDGTINMTFFIERPPIPKSVTMEIDTVDGRVINQVVSVSSDTKVGVIREVPISINMDIDVAKKVADWLNTHINNFESSISNTKGHEI